MENSKINKVAEKTGATHPVEAITEDPNNILRERWEIKPESFTPWDAFLALKSMRNANQADLPWIKALSSRFEGDERVKNMIGWVMFDQYVKGRDRNALLGNESDIADLCKLTSQKDRSGEEMIPCPKTITVLRMAAAFSKNNFNGRKVGEWLGMLDQDKLSIKPNAFQSAERGPVENASDIEKFLALKTKVLYEAGDYEACRVLSSEALERIPNLHHDNQIWFRLRLARSEDKLGNPEAAFELYSSLIRTRTGSGKWFIHAEFADLLYRQNEYEKAWRCTLDAAFHGNEPQFMVNLYYLQAKILYHLGRQAEAKPVAILIAAVYRGSGWPLKVRISNLLNFYGIKMENVPPVKAALAQVADFLRSERYKGLEALKGRITFIHGNNKKGRIRAKDGKTYAFGRNAFVKKQFDLQRLKGANVTFYIVQDSGVHAEAEHIAVIGPKGNKGSIPVGSILSGSIKRIVDYGMFIRLDRGGDGLLHRNHLPGELKHSFGSKFSEGQVVKVKILEKTDKGYALAYAGKGKGPQDQ